MSKDRINRREAIDRIMKTIALAAGVSMTECRDLLATDFAQLKPKQKPKLFRKYSIYQKSANKQIKALKVMVENNRRVFENEFGRQTPIVQKTVRQAIPGRWIDRGWVDPGDFGNPANVCPVHFNGFGEVFTDSFICVGENDCTGQDVNGGSGCAGSNTCSGQSCDGFVCSGNDCDGQNCGDFDYCEKNKQKLFDASLFERYKTDPYVQDLMRRFNVTTSRALANRVRNMLAQRRATIYKKQRQMHIPKQR